MSDWKLVGTVDPDRIADARRQAHWAVQVISAAGETYLKHLPDTSHTSAEWVTQLGALVGAPVREATNVRVGVRLADLTLLLIDASGRVVGHLALAGQTLSDAYGWVSRAVRRQSSDALDCTLVHPGYELPAYAIAKGEKFQAVAELEELASWYGNADGVLRRLGKDTPGASPVVCWPHHFDIATLITLETDDEGAATKTIGVGLSPGDDEIPRPYWYVNHWPSVDVSDLPALDGDGHWVTEHWTGAVLDARDLVATRTAAAQRAQVERFLVSALAAARSLLS